jgi:hypothetical protein
MEAKEPKGHKEESNNRFTLVLIRPIETMTCNLFLDIVLYCRRYTLIQTYCM